MNRIETCSDPYAAPPCAYDLLDGRPLQDGETLLIEWPSGYKSQHLIHIEEACYPDIGFSAIGLPSRHAYIDVPKGPGRVYIRGMRAQRVTS